MINGIINNCFTIHCFLPRLHIKVNLAFFSASMHVRFVSWECQDFRRRRRSEQFRTQNDLVPVSYLQKSWTFPFSQFLHIPGKCVRLPLHTLFFQPGIRNWSHKREIKVFNSQMRDSRLRHVSWGRYIKEFKR